MAFIINKEEMGWNLTPKPKFGNSSPIKRTQKYNINGRSLTLQEACNEITDDPKAVKSIQNFMSKHKISLSSAIHRYKNRRNGGGNMSADKTTFGKSL